MGKELKRLRKELAELTAKDKRFHFLLLSPGETEEEKVKQLMAAGSMAQGDEYQVIQIPWHAKTLIGGDYIPEGNSADPFADPQEGKQPEVVDPSFKEQREREERWKKHVAQIQRDGDRFGFEKPKGTPGIY